MYNSPVRNMLEPDIQSSHRQVSSPPTASSASRGPLPIQTLTSVSSSDLNMLSPPITPDRKPDAILSQLKAGFLPTPRSSVDERPAFIWSTLQPRKFPGQYHLCQRIGSGAWSNVFLAQEVSAPNPTLQTMDGTWTPPPSPGMTARQIPKLLAVKKPSQKAAFRVIAREAKVLTYLSGSAASSSAVIGFHGLEDTTGSMILDYAPLTLRRFTAERNAAMRHNFSTKTMCDPIMGESGWKELARSLISSLAWLHEQGVVHGDIKAENILMRRKATIGETIGDDGDTQLAYEPVFCDFSSAQLDEESPDERDGADDAVTTTYASPELLNSFRFSTGKLEKPVDRRKADVWALAVCLVVAAVGEEPYSAAPIPVMRVAMAKNGDVLGSVRGGSNASRIMKGGFVAKTVAMALNKDSAERVSAVEWLMALDF